MKIINCIQGSDEWHDARLGKITASRVSDILPGKSGYKVAREKYLVTLICEILTGEVRETFVPSWAMQHGIDVEQAARSSYEVFVSDFLEQPGFIIHDTYDFLGCSPDGMRKNEIGVEIKCPNSEVHLNTILHHAAGEKSIPPNYYTQIQTSLLCTGFDEWDYVTYDNRFSQNLQLHVQSVMRDEEHIKLIETECIKFWEELSTAVEKLKMIGIPEPAPESSGELELS